MEITGKNAVFTDEIFPRLANQHHRHSCVMLESYFNIFSRSFQPLFYCDK